MRVDGTNIEDTRGEPTERPHVVRRIGTVVLWAALVVGLVAAAAIAVVPALTGARAMTVLSGSMEPALPVGAVVVAREMPPDQIAVGDVITYTDRDPDSPATRVVTHRVIDIVQEPEGLAFGTKGDANNGADPGTTAAADIIGVQWYSVPWVGTIRESLTTPVGLSYAAGILLLILAAHLLLPHTQPVRTAAAAPSAARRAAEERGPDPADAPTERLPLVTAARAPFPADRERHNRAGDRPSRPPEHPRPSGRPHPGRPNVTPLHRSS